MVGITAAPQPEDAAGDQPGLVEQLGRVGAAAALDRDKARAGAERRAHGTRHKGCAALKCLAGGGLKYDAPGA